MSRGFQVKKGEAIVMKGNELRVLAWPGLEFPINPYPNLLYSGVSRQHEDVKIIEFSVSSAFRLSRLVYFPCALA